MADGSVAGRVHVVGGRAKRGRTTSERSVIDAIDVGHDEGDVTDPVTVAADVVGDDVVRPEPARHEKADVALLEEIRDALAATGLGSGVGDRGEAESRCQEAGEGSRIADPPLEMVDAAEPRRCLCVGDRHADAPLSWRTAPSSQRARNRSVNRCTRDWALCPMRAARFV
jgi:hypothetical protein